MTAQDVQQVLRQYAAVGPASLPGRFFKTGEGQYSADDIFIGTRAPDIRKVCKQCANLSLREVQKLLDSEVHEFRMAGAILLSDAYPKADDMGRKAIFDIYLHNVYSGRINNWDLVDVSAGFIVGEYLKDKPRDLLFKLAKSNSLWQRRVAMISCFQFIKSGDATTALQICEVLVNDKEDLIQKAVGWMLREIGKRVGEKPLTDFLNQHAHNMPRTTLRYSIERLTPAQKLYYMWLKNA